MSKKTIEKIASKVIDSLLFKKTKRLEPGTIHVATSINHVLIVDKSYGSIFNRKLGINVTDMNLQLTREGTLIISITKKEEDEKI